MSRVPSILRIYLLDDRSTDLDHASSIIDRLAARRSVDGACPEWRVLYETADVSEAMEMCAADLDALDPRWRETFDFSVSTRLGPSQSGRR